VSTQLRGVLAQNASSYTWVAATIGSNRAAGFQLATGSPVMAIGGFNGSDPSPTLTRFQEYVRQGRIHWFVGDAAGGAGGPGMRAMGGSDAAREIAAWVQRTFPARTVDGVTLYDLTAGTGASA
jgi:hypothetical protein